MWSEYKTQYKKTLVVTQLTIAVVSLGAWFETRSAVDTFACLATMQVGAVLGALWGARLRTRAIRLR